MYKHTAFLFFLCTLATCFAQAQPSEPIMHKEEYIERFKDDAIREMHASGIPASITLAQGMLESSYGNSPLAKYANNHFGIKCHKGWDGPTFIQDDDEKNECFRKYYDPYDSYRDHTIFLQTRDRYAFLFELKTTDYKGWARGLKKAGYATNPKYADLLIKIIEENNLQQYDKIVKLPETEGLANVPVPTHQKATRHVLAVRQVQISENNIKYVLATNGDSPGSIAKQNNMGLWQILKYNDLQKGQALYEGEIIYLQPKRNNASAETHTVAAGETLHSISQKHGIKLKRIRKLNNLEENYVPAEGDVLKLRRLSRIETFLTGR